MGLAKAIVQLGGHHDIFVACSNAFPDTIEPLRAALEPLLRPGRFAVFEAPRSAAHDDPSQVWTAEAGELARESFLAALKPDLVHVSSLFEGYRDPAVTSVRRLGLGPLTAVTLYDLIPLLYSDPYLRDAKTKHWYYRKLSDLKRADLWLAISEASRRDGVKLLGLPEDRTINIGGAIEDMFVQIDYNEPDANAILATYGLRPNFVMYTGGVGDFRKNIEGLIKAFSLVPEKLRRIHQLAIVCKIDEYDRKVTSNLIHANGLTENDVIMTGFVPDCDLVLLYNLCGLFVFPSFYEGFGLPVLEAMACGAPVIASNNSSIPEIIDRPDSLLDPHDAHSIARMITSILGNAELRADLKEYSLTRARVFSWEVTAQKTIESFEKLHDETGAGPKNTAIVARSTLLRPRLAYVSPVPPVRSGVAAYSACLVRELSRYYEVDLIVDQDEISDEWLLANHRAVHWRALSAPWQSYDRVLYHMGNSPNHAYMLALIEQFGGVVVLHDFYIGHLLADLEWREKESAIWCRHLLGSHGYAALLERFREGDLKASWEYPCNLQLLGFADGVITHSQLPKELFEQWYGQTRTPPWEIVPHFRHVQPAGQRVAARSKLGLSHDDLLICSFGVMGAHKRNDTVLKAWLASRLAHDARCRLVFVGENDGGEYGQAILRLIGTSPRPDQITVLGYVCQELYETYLSAADAAVQLRGQSRGETSGALLDCLAHGIPTVINAHGTLAEMMLRWSSGLTKMPPKVS